MKQEKSVMELFTKIFVAAGSYPQTKNILK